MRTIDEPISKGVPPPEDTRISWKPQLDRLKVGESFKLPDYVDDHKKARQSISQYGRSCKKRKKFKVQAGRCWRVE